MCLLSRARGNGNCDAKYKKATTGTGYAASNYCVAPSGCSINGTLGCPTTSPCPSAATSALPGAFPCVLLGCPACSTSPPAAAQTQLFPLEPKQPATPAGSLFIGVDASTPGFFNITLTLQLPAGVIVGPGQKFSAYVSAVAPAGDGTLAKRQNGKLGQECTALAR
ncbi:hypothetical protein WJX81_007974 [Elliptochloris bilobata]|uniref:Uncharacterized protein n=1 Tax=Elliptochloris bilobata TaxID=381761 RepID=A0AAW1RRA3_9CHLO